MTHPYPVRRRQAGLGAPSVRLLADMILSLAGVRTKLQELALIERPTNRAMGAPYRPNQITERDLHRSFQNNEGVCAGFPRYIREGQE
jgi:hypothetical protein